MLRSHLVIAGLLSFSFFLALPYIHYGVAIIIGAILHHQNRSKPALITFEDVQTLLQTPGLPKLKRARASLRL